MPGDVGDLVLEVGVVFIGHILGLLVAILELAHYVELVGQGEGDGGVGIATIHFH